AGAEGIESHGRSSLSGKNEAGPNRKRAGLIGQNQANHGVSAVSVAARRVIVCGPSTLPNPALQQAADSDTEKLGRV
ncbi:MAG: hypothetical protein MI861_17540, partial [Pirellulales bacterium]|nr:hypothetical protein [Pirellulales bacterium]